jgi:hypothetical protein
MESSSPSSMGGRRRHGHQVTILLVSHSTYFEVIVLSKVIGNASFIYRLSMQKGDTFLLRHRIKDELDYRLRDHSLSDY